MPDAFRRAVARAVAETSSQGADADAPRRLWRALGGSGVIKDLYRAGDATGTLSVELLRRLLTELDSQLPIGVVLSVCVQVASVLPILTTPSPPRARPAAVLRGEQVVALAATDSAVSGSDLLDMATHLSGDANDLVLTGGKHWITNATQCDQVLVLARHRPERHFTSFCWLLLPIDLPGVSVVADGRTGFAGAGLGHFTFDHVRVGSEHLVGGRGRAMAEFARAMATERLAAALWADAVCRRVLMSTHAHLTSRASGVGVLWDNAAVRERFARCVVRWRQLQAMCTAQKVVPDAVEGMLLKVTASEVAAVVVSECADLWGAAAFGEEGLAELRAQVAMFGTAGGATGAMLSGVADRATDLLRDDP